MWVCLFVNLASPPPFPTPLPLSLVDAEGEVMELRALWGKVLNHDILLPNRCLVFDFGAEVYLWSGKQASAKQRSKGTAFLKKLADEGSEV